MRNQTEIEGSSVLVAQQRSAKYRLLALATALALLPTCMQGAEPTGEEVVAKVCVACHGTGANGAPKIGDTQAWAARASQGLSSLTVHALEGIRNMPAHGGDPKLSDIEIARAVTYMVNQSGGNWVEPASPEDLAVELTGEQVVKAQCSQCHAEGVEGAPKIGDLKAWVERMKLGLPYLVGSAIHGHGGMPPRGGRANLTDTEIRSAILYMFNPAGSPPHASLATASPVEDPNHRSVGGVEIYLGFMPADRILALPTGAPERAMHGGVPRRRGYYHVNVTLLDEKSQTPINDAQVQMQFNWPGMTGVPINLEPMSIGGGGSYGYYVRPQPGTWYVITLEISRPRATQTVEAKFQHYFE